MCKGRLGSLAKWLSPPEDIWMVSSPNTIFVHLVKTVCFPFAFHTLCSCMFSSPPCTTRNFRPLTLQLMQHYDPVALAAYCASGASFTRTPGAATSPPAIRAVDGANNLHRANGLQGKHALLPCSTRGGILSLQASVAALPNELYSHLSLAPPTYTVSEALYCLALKGVCLRCSSQRTCLRS